MPGFDDWAILEKSSSYYKIVTSRRTEGISIHICVTEKCDQRRTSRNQRNLEFATHRLAFQNHSRYEPARFLPMIAISSEYLNHTGFESFSNLVREHRDIWIAERNVISS